MSSQSWKKMRITTPADILEAPLPHFQDAEKRIFQAYILETGKFGLWAFDIPLPHDEKLLAEKIKDPLVREIAKYLTAKKVDAAFSTAAGWEICEIKRRPLLSGIGQLLGYKDLWSEIYRDEPISKLIYVTVIDDPQIRTICERNGIEFYVVRGLEYLGARW